ncbi:protein kinase domain-containing protein [Acrocarpospora corrugata]|nr:protein kinase [Acrocarpospora corrugata]
MADAGTREFAASSPGPRLVAGRYRLMEPLGRGGMGTVWRALDESLQREVAIKEQDALRELTAHERQIYTVRTFREARAAGRLSHPAVAAVYDVFEEAGHPWIVMQLVSSRTLGEVVQAEGPLPPRRVAEIGLQLVGALTAAHAAGVLHRDVKPDNVLLADDGRVVLTDFGIATLEDDSPVTRTGALIGTPAFIAPERASGGTAQRESDLWSLGVTLFAAVEGRSPFQRGHALASLAAVMYEGPGPLCRAGALAPVLLGLLRKDPARRMTAEEAERALRAIVDGTAPAPTEEVPLPVPGPVSPRRRRWWPLAAATGTLFIGLAAGGIAYLTAEGDGRARVPEPAVSSVVDPPKTSEPPQEPARDPAPSENRRPAEKPSKKPSPSQEPSEEPTEQPTDEPPDDPSDESDGMVDPDAGELQAQIEAGIVPPGDVL